jgi:hypothetical protein
VYPAVRDVIGQVGSPFLYRSTREDPGPALQAGDFEEAVVQLHVLY